MLAAILHSLNCEGQAINYKTHSKRLPADVAAAWAEVEEETPILRAPRDWANRSPALEEEFRFRMHVLTTAPALAKKCREVLNRVSTNEAAAADARFVLVYALCQAVAAGDSASEKEARQFVAATVADDTIPAEERARIYVESAYIGVLRLAGMRYFMQGRQKFREEMDRAAIEALHKARSHFPTNDYVDASILAIADRCSPEMQREVANEVLEALGSSPAAKAYARHLRNGVRPYEMGKPPIIQFKALDERQVDLKRMRGKVVLVQFWARASSRSTEGTSGLKGLYDRFHTVGLEIIGINEDGEETALYDFIKERNLPWPQYFDGKNPAARLAVRYGVVNVPTLWLIDKNGNLRDVNTNSEVEAGIAKLLAE